ncbi:hypothetical protein CLF_108479 [Clonorchis sinensis]|uniref:Reverse transcriptase domain-containing protein n=1 Tax=Clonorchis sinensis TaxID=79923 RepID=G7YI48_CLOSI|nr:hypothetical protein CLF_108479 [Clonorchis sinensis]
MDPLSPVLFTMTMDEALGLSILQLGYRSHYALLIDFVFADERDICVESQTHLKEKLEAAVVELGRAGKSINARKVICEDRKHRATAVSIESFCFAEEVIASASSTDTVTYLAAPFIFNGKGVYR